MSGASCVRPLESSGRLISRAGLETRRERGGLLWVKPPIFLGATLSLLICASAVRAQLTPPPLQRPVEERPEVPDLEPPEAPLPERILPPVPPSPPSERERLSTGLSVFAREYRFSGNTVFSNSELAELATPYTGRTVSTEDLETLRRAVTLHYVERGYVNSGAILPDQDVAEGVIELRIIEGRLTTVQIEGNKWFRTRYLRDRLDPGEDRPLQVEEIENRLQLLQQDRRIRRVNAALGPGAVPGEGILRVRVEEASPLRGWMEFSNYESPSIGEYRGRAYLAHENLSGNGDALSVEYSLTDGLNDIEFRYELPITAQDTRLELRYWWSKGDVIEDPFDDLEIESRSVTYTIGFSHPVYRSLDDELRLGVVGEYRESRTYLLGERFSFSAGAENGKSRVSVLRFWQEWTHRDRAQVVAARSTVSIGLDALGATTHSGNTPDGRFVAWLGQTQWIRRFEPSGIEALLRADVQLASDPLLSLEQFSAGGFWSVRGYRENQIVRDRGLVVSLETRIPLWRGADERPILQLAPFFDIGRTWNKQRDTPSPRTLCGAGVGLRWLPSRRLEATLYWGAELRDIPEPEDRALQDRGIYLRVLARTF